MNSLTIALSSRVLVIILAVLLALLLLTAFMLGHAHPGAIHTIAQSTESILD